MQTSAWGSDEHILSEPDTSKDITVVSETIVKSEPFTGQEAPGVIAPPKEWTSGLSRQ
jgi:hypothetical protein